MSAPPLPRPFRPLPLRAANALGRGLARVGVRGISLAESRLLAAASRATGLSDFGDEEFRSGMRALLASLEAEAHLTAFGRYFARRQMLELLTHRLQLVDWRKRHPEVARQEIARPLFVLGLPRTGTTLLYGLLAEDPVARAPLSWETDDPCPPAEVATYATDPRIAHTEARFQQIQRLAPGVQAVHPIGALLPQECIVLTASAFRSIRFEMTFDVPSYQEWLLQADMRPAYAWHRRFLQHLQSRFSRERWVLKSPGHVGPIAALLDTYPDALIVQTHRDPRRAIPSVASLELHLRQISSDHVDPERLGAQQLRFWSRLLAQGVAARDAHPERAKQFLDLHYAEIVADPIGCVGRVYAHFGLPLSDAAEARMRAHLVSHPRDAHGTHRYTLAGFGLDAERVDAEFGAYVARFGIPREDEA